MTWSHFALVPLLACGLACLSEGRVRRGAVRCVALTTRASVLAALSLLGVLLLAPEWLPAGLASSLDDRLLLPTSDAAGPSRLLLGLLYAMGLTLVAAPLLALLDFTHSLGRFESDCRTLTHLMRDTLRLAENARPCPAASPSSAPALSGTAPRHSANRLRPLSELLG
jgi:hypothetical protein